MAKRLDLEKEIKALPDAELERFVNEIKFPLSGLGIGEAKAFNLLAKIEHVAITEYQKRGLHKSR